MPHGQRITGRERQRLIKERNIGFIGGTRTPESDEPRVQRIRTARAGIATGIQAQKDVAARNRTILEQQGALERTRLTSGPGSAPRIAAETGRIKASRFKTKVFDPETGQPTGEQVFNIVNGRGVPIQTGTSGFTGFSTPAIMAILQQASPENQQKILDGLTPEQSAEVAAAIGEARPTDIQGGVPQQPTVQAAPPVFNPFAQREEPTDFSEQNRAAQARTSEIFQGILKRARIRSKGSTAGVDSVSRYLGGESRFQRRFQNSGR